MATVFVFVVKLAYAEKALRVILADVLRFDRSQQGHLNGRCICGSVHVQHVTRPVGAAPQEGQDGQISVLAVSGSQPGLVIHKKAAAAEWLLTGPRRRSIMNRGQSRSGR